jgi:hypothetical protein
MNKTHITSKVVILNNKRVQLKQLENELKYRIIHRLNFNRKSCKRFFTIEIKKSVALYIKQKYCLTSSFKQYCQFDNDFSIYSFRNFFGEIKYWTIAENSFQIRISKKRKKRYFPNNISQIETVHSFFFNLSFRFMIRSF